MQERNTFEWMARLGYAARGIVYLIIGGFALLAAFGAQGRTVGAKGALEAVLAQPFGALLLWIVAAGLLCFAGWRLLQALLDVDHCGRTPSGLIRRGVYAGAVLFYAGLAVWAASLVFTGPGSGSDDQLARDWTGWLLGKPLGQVLTIVIGIGIAAVGIGSGLTGCSARIRQRLAVGEDARPWLVFVGRFGFVSRAVLFLMIGTFLVFSAWHYDATEAAGLSGALRALQSQRYGGALFAVAAFGLFGFGAFQIIQALFRSVDTPSMEEAAAQAKAAVKT